MCSAQHSNSENGKLVVPKEERGWAVISAGRNVTDAHRVNEQQSHPYASSVRTYSSTQRERKSHLLWVLQ